VVPSHDAPGSVSLFKLHYGYLWLCLTKHSDGSYFHTPCSERSRNKQESARKHHTEAEGTQQVLAFVPKEII
jgi:hypothetical protein